MLVFQHGCNDYQDYKKMLLHTYLSNTTMVTVDNEGSDGLNTVPFVQIVRIWANGNLEIYIDEDKF